MNIFLDFLENFSKFPDVFHFLKINILQNFLNGLLKMFYIVSKFFLRIWKKISLTFLQNFPQNSS